MLARETMANSGTGFVSASALSPPRNVEQITKAAQDYDYNAQVPLRYWLRTASALPQQADIYNSEGDEETTYLLLFRHAHLILTNLTAHPDAKDPSLKSQLAQANRQVNKNLKTLDILKPRINERYERYNQLVREREARRSSATYYESTSVTPKYSTDASTKPGLKHLDGHEHSDLAVQIAQRELLRRADARHSVKPVQRPGPTDSDELSHRLQSIRSKVEPSHNAAIIDTPKQHNDLDQQTGYNYPKVRVRDHREPLETQLQTNVHQFHGSEYSTRLPTRPPKPSLRNDATDVLPPRPAKLQPSKTVQTPEPKYTFASTATLENGSPLRTLFLPPTLRTTFLRLAYKNTLANLETCAFLAGTLVSNALFVSKLVVPAQTATSDTCEMTNESQLFDYIDSQDDLMVLGWIHTHPTQTCFMSSRDLHTHSGYQMMLAESVAVVCAPSKGDVSHGGDWGVYRLTDPPGKMAIINCTKPGLFHPHDVDNVYTDALRPGHVVEAKGLDFEVIDLRDT